MLTRARLSSLLLILAAALFAPAVPAQNDQNDKPEPPHTPAGLQRASTLPTQIAPKGSAPRVERSAASPSRSREFDAGVATVVAVEVPVQVLVQGKPVRGLTADDFEIVDGKKTQKLTGFEVVDLTPTTTTAAAPAAAPPPVGRRHFLILLDLANSDPAAIVRARSAAQDVVKTALHPSDLVAVAVYKAQTGPQLLLNFTSDRRQIDIALATLGNPDLFDRNPDVLAVTLADVGHYAIGGGGASEAQEAKDQVVIEYLEGLVQHEEKVERQAQIAKVDRLTRSLADLGKLMGAVDGRKFVVFLSQGFDSSLLTGSTDEAEMADMNASAEQGRIWEVDSEQKFGSSRSQNQLESMMEEFRRADCVIEAVDIGGLAAGADQRQRASGRDALFAMAKGTGGQLFENTNNLQQAMGSMLQSTSVTYILTYQPQDLKLDGKYRPIKVRLKNPPSGAQLMHRPGYYAPLPYEQQRGIERQLDTADLLLAGEAGGSLLAGAVLTPFKMEAGRAFVPVIVEVDGRSLLGLHRDKVIGVDVFAYVLDSTGTVRDYMAQSLQLDVAKLGDKLKEGNVRVMGSLFLAPGDYVTRVLVRESGGEYALRIVPLSVPDFATGKAFALPPLFPEPMTSGIVPRPATNPRKPKDPMFPFVVGKDEFYLPNGLPRLASGGAARLVWLTYGLPKGEIAVQPQVFTVAGAEVPGATAKLLERANFDQPGLERWTVELSAPKLGAGDYVLRFSVTDPTTGAVTASVASFTVGS